MRPWYQTKAFLLSIALFLRFCRGFPTCSMDTSTWNSGQYRDGPCFDRTENFLYGTVYFVLLLTFICSPISRPRYAMHFRRVVSLIPIPGAPEISCIAFTLRAFQRWNRRPALDMLWRCSDFVGCIIHAHVQKSTQSESEPLIAHRVFCNWKFEIGHGLLSLNV